MESLSSMCLRVPSLTPACAGKYALISLITTVAFGLIAAGSLAIAGVSALGGTGVGIGLVAGGGILFIAQIVYLLSRRSYGDVLSWNEYQNSRARIKPGHFVVFNDPQYGLMCERRDNSGEIIIVAANINYADMKKDYPQMKLADFK